MKEFASSGMTVSVVIQDLLPFFLGLVGAVLTGFFTFLVKAISQMKEDMAVLKNEVIPPNDKSMKDKLTDVKQDIAVMKEQIENMDGDSQS